MAPDCNTYSDCNSDNGDSRNNTISESSFNSAPTANFAPKCDIINTNFHSKNLKFMCSNCDGLKRDDKRAELSCIFQIGAGLYAVGRSVQKSNITQQKRTAKSAPITPCPSREGPYSTVFSVSRPMDPLMWLAGLLALSGDVETNPGPTTQTWTCDMCSTEITRRQTSYRCNSSPSHWVHEHCTTLRRNTDYTPTWKCNIHNQQNNTITDQHHQLTDNNNNMQQNLNINQPHSINNNKSQQQINSKKTITIIQITINGLTTKIHELKNLTDNTKIDIITI